MSDHIELHNAEKMSYDTLGAAVSDTWTPIGVDTLQSLIDSMPARCAAYILDVASVNSGRKPQWKDALSKEGHRTFQCKSDQTIYPG